MAKKRIEKEDIAPKGVFDNITEGAKEAKAYVDILTEAVKVLKVAAEDIKAGLQNAKVGDTKGMKDFDELTRKANATAEAKLQIDKKLLIEQQKLRQLRNDQSKLIKTEVESTTQLTKAQEKNLGTLQKLELQNRQLRAERAKLNLDTKEGTARMKEINAQLDINNQKIKESGDAMKKQRMNVGNYEGAVNKLKGALSSLGLAFGIGAIARDALNVVKDFGQANQTLAAILGTTTDQTKALQEQQKFLGATTSFTAANVAELQTELAKLGFSQKEIEQSTEGVLLLAKAAGVDLADAASVAGATLRGFGLETSEMARVTDVMAKSFSTSALDMEKFKESMKLAAPVAKAVGVTVEDTTAMLGSLANAGISGSMAGNALKRIFGEIAATGKPVKEALKDMASANLDLVGANDEVGKAAATALLILNDSADGTEKLAEQYRNAKGSAKEMADTMDDSLSGALNRLRSAYEGVILGADGTSGASETLKNMVDFLANNLERIISIIVLGVKAYGLWRIATYAQIVANKLLATSSEKALSSISAGFKKIGDFLKANVISIAISAMVIAFMKIKSILNEMNAPWTRIVELNKNLASISEKAAQKIGEEKAELQLLIGQIKSHNAGSKERGELLQQLNEKYGIHLKNINDETEANKQLDAAQKEIIANMKNQILLQARQEKYIEIIKAVQVAEDEYNAAIAVNRAKINKMSDKEIESWVERLAKMTPYGDKLRELSMAEKRRYLIEDNLSSKDLTKKLALEKLRERELSFQKDLQTEMAKNTQAATLNGNAVSTANSDKTSSQKALNVEMDKYNEYLTKQTNLLNKIALIEKDRESRSVQQEIDLKLSEDVQKALESSIVDTEEIEALVEKKFAIERAGIELKAQFEREKLEETFQLEQQLAEQKVRENYEKLISQEGLSAKERQKIEENYQLQLEQLEQDQLQRNADLQLELRILSEATKDELLKLEKEKNDQINDINDKLIEAQIKYTDKQKELSDEVVENEKKNWDKITKIVDSASTYIEERADRRIAKIEEEIEAYKREAETLRRLSDEGNIRATESIALNERLAVEAERKKDQLEKQKQNALTVTAILQAYSSNMANGDDSLTAFTKAISTKEAIDQYVKGLAAFYDGTEDTGVVSRGLDSNGGRLAVLHNNERVMTAKQNAMLGDISNEEVARIVQQKRFGMLAEKSTNSVIFKENNGSELIVSRLESLEKAIMDKPEVNIDVERIIDGAMIIARTTKKGKTITVNRYRIQP